MDRHTLLAELEAQDNQHILDIPKVELHVHIEGTLTPELRWKLAERQGIPLIFGRNEKAPANIAELKEQYDSNPPEDFFPAYYGGFRLLNSEEDFYELAMGYFERVSLMNVRYCEIFFDPQGHIGRGVSWHTMMGGFRKAKKKAESELNVKSSWLACFERDQTPESAMEHYSGLLNYRDMVAGIGLASNEDDRPPSLFHQLFNTARRDGFRIASHCNVGSKNINEHIRQVASEIGGSGADRIDHGINAADRQELVDLIKSKDLGLTLIPWAYVRFDGYEDTANRLQKLSAAGIKIGISSDDPAYVGDCWVTHNLMLAKRMCNWTDEDVTKVVKDSIAMSWADQDIKDTLLKDMQNYLEKRGTSAS